VRIATGVASSSAQSAAPAHRGGHLRGALFIALGVLVLPIAIRRKRLGALFSLVLLLSVAGISSCAGSGGGGGGTPPVSPGSNTPAGTYPVVVTATASGVSHKVTLTLTVD
jgi:hypothetical protein